MLMVVMVGDRQYGKTHRDSAAHLKIKLYLEACIEGCDVNYSCL
jgi:hypothetical protein